MSCSGRFPKKKRKENTSKELENFLMSIEKSLSADKLKKIISKRMKTCFCQSGNRK